MSELMWQHALGQSVEHLGVKVVGFGCLELGLLEFCFDFNAALVAQTRQKRGNTYRERIPHVSQCGLVH